MMYPSPPAVKKLTVMVPLLFFLTFFSSIEPAGGRQTSEQRSFHSESELWQAAERALAAGDREKAAVLFGQFQQRFFQSSRAEQALWQAARLHEELALVKKDADWARVRDLYRLYVIEYPDSEQLPTAYLSLGLAHFRMHFYREALVYLNLFLEKYSDSPLRTEARYWQGRTLEAIGRFEEAEKSYQELTAGTDPHFRLKALVALGDLFFAKGSFHGALAYYQAPLKELSPSTLEYQEVIRRIGMTNGRLGYETASRDHLYRYLNVVEDSSHLAEVFFELGESYWRQQELGAAIQLYMRALEKGEPGARPVVLSRFRQALYLSLREKDPSSWQKIQDDPSPAGDLAYEAVLNTYGREPIAQEARQALLRRLMAREDHEQAMLLAKSYINHLEAGAAHQKEVESILGQLLVRRVENLLKEGEYRQVFDLYQQESKHMQAYDQGRLLYLVGQAMEALGLYDQAAVIYYRTLARELSPAEKTELYQRRARVYLAQNDLAAAERLLRFLRNTYRGRPEAAEFLLLSGRLREMQGKPEDAAAFLAEGCTVADGTGGSAVCQARVGLLLRLHRLEEAADAFAAHVQQNRLTPEATQQLSAEVGDAWRRQGNLERAAAAYAVGAGENLPQGGERAQAIHLRLGEVLLSLGRLDSAKDHLEKARTGPDQLLLKSAERGLGQIKIQQGMAGLRQPPAGGVP